MTHSKVSTKKILCLFFTFGLTSCGSDYNSVNSTPAPPPHTSNIELDEISGEKCMNLEKYLNLLKSSIGDKASRTVSTGFEVRPLKNNTLSENFELRLALGNFIFEDSTLSQLNDLNSISQIECEKVVRTTESGPQEYRITSSKKESMTIKNLWDDEITYTWISPFHLKITSTFVSGDFLCSEKTKSRVSVTKDIIWEQEVLSKDQVRNDFIKDTYLNLLSEATGYSKNNLFLPPEAAATIPPSTPPEIPLVENGIFIQRLKTMASQPIRPELLGCTN